MSSPLRIVALEPWLGGSHARFLEQWQGRTRHELAIEGLPARSWKWRMRAGAWELARRVADGPPPDVYFASDYLDLATFRGFLPPEHARVPAVLYFHENQLTYPAPPGTATAERDHHFGFTNVLSCIAAQRVIFNSRYHLEEFAGAASELLERLPRPNPRDELVRALERAQVVAPGVDLDELPLGRGGAPGEPLRVLFNHRFEHDKDPLAFLDAVIAARAAGACIELVLCGERYARTPDGVAQRLSELAPCIAHSGFVASREEYVRLLGSSDLVVSTARHEFFGMAVVEAMATGCTPLLPKRLNYPALLSEALGETGLYEDALAFTAALISASRSVGHLRLPDARHLAREAAAAFSVERTAGELDECCAALARDSHETLRRESVPDG